MAPWSYPGFFQAFSPPVGPRQGPFGRNNGVTVWGQVGGGLFKYYAGAFDLFDMAESPLFSGRVNLSLLAPEPGYLHSSAYYGKNILAAGVGAQFKKNGSVSAMPDVMADNFAEINADILYEHPFQNTSVLDVEAAVYAYAGANEAVKSSFYALASYLLPTTVGFGKLQPLVRFQGAVPKDGGDMWRILEAQLGYVVKPYAARLAVVYQRTDVADQTANAIIFGVQLQK
jgi:hypothetical protein